MREFAIIVVRCFMCVALVVIFGFIVTEVFGVLAEMFFKR